MKMPKGISKVNTKGVKVFRNWVAIIVASVILTAVFFFKYPSINVNLTHIKEDVFQVKQGVAIETKTKAGTDSVTIETKTKARTSSVSVVNATKHYICPDFKSFGRFGNKIHIYASNYGIARSKGMELYIDASCPLLRLFKIKTSVIHGPRPCKKVKKVIESMPMGYSEKVLNFTNDSDVQPLRYLQSWRYFDAYSNDLRQQLKFRDDIRMKVNSLLQACIQKHGLDNKTVTLIGVHVRRGDIVETLGMGKKVVTKEYLKAAADWYKSRYKNLLFIVASDGMAWTKKNMPHDILVSYLGNSQEIDLATIGSCNHFIMSIGTFGWWAGWLTGGNVIYYKWPARDNTTWRRLFSHDYADHYYPNWIGL